MRVDDLFVEVIPGQLHVVPHNKTAMGKRTMLHFWNLEVGYESDIFKNVLICIKVKCVLRNYTDFYIKTYLFK